MFTLRYQETIEISVLLLKKLNKMLSCYINCIGMETAQFLTFKMLIIRNNTYIHHLKFLPKLVGQIQDLLEDPYNSTTWRK